MSTIDGIEAELKQISPWPWGWFNGCSWWRLGKADDQMQHDSVICPTIDSDGHSNLICHQEDREFLAKSPERLAALCRYARAVEDYLENHRLSLPEELSSGCKTWVALQSVRRELGLGKE